MNRLTIIAATAALALVLTACQEQSPTTPSTPPTPTTSPTPPENMAPEKMTSGPEKTTTEKSTEKTTEKPVQ